MMGKKLREIRKSKGMSMRKLSDLSGVSDSYISDLENGKNNRPSVDVISRLSEALEVSALEFLDKNNSINEEYINSDEFKSITSSYINRSISDEMDLTIPFIEFINKERLDSKYDIAKIIDGDNYIDLMSILCDVINNRLKIYTNRLEK